MNILVDSSVWIDYFKSGIHSAILDCYITENLICINDLVLAELIPFLKIKKQHHLIQLLYDVTHIPLKVDWQKIINYQTICLKNGIHRVGIPDLIILDSVIQNELTLFTFDKHFGLISKHVAFNLL